MSAAIQEPTDPRARWEAELDAVRQRVLAGGGRPGVAPREQLRDKTGLQILHAMLDGSLPYPPISETLDFALLEAVWGKVVFQGTPQMRHYNPLGSVHGGWYATMLDSALGCAVQTIMPVGRTYTTAELGIHIVRAATERTGPLRATGVVVHGGRQVATAEARIEGPDGKLYAHGSTTCLVFDMPA